MISNELKKEIVDRIREVSSPIKIYLFGSYAYGNPSAESDLDIAVIMDQVESRIKQATTLWNALKDTDFPKDIVVASRSEFEFYRHEAGSIFKTIAEKGVILYG